MQQRDNSSRLKMFVPYLRIFWASTYFGDFEELCRVLFGHFVKAVNMFEYVWKKDVLCYADVETKQKMKKAQFVV